MRAVKDELVRPSRAGDFRDDVAADDGVAFTSPVAESDAPRAERRGIRGSRARVLSAGRVSFDSFQEIERDFARDPAAELQGRRIERREDESGQGIAAGELRERITGRRFFVDDEHSGRARFRRGLELHAHAPGVCHAASFEAEIAAGLEVGIVRENDGNFAGHVDAFVRVPATSRIDDAVAGEDKRRVGDSRALGVAKRERRVAAEGERDRPCRR